MSGWVSLLDGAVVSVFGSVLAASFCDALKTRRNRWSFWCCTGLILLLQGGVYALCGSESLRQVYPLTTHLPLALVLCFLTKAVWWPVISVFTAYLCCQLRRWIALLVIAAISGGPLVQDMVELLITLPLLFLLMRYVSVAMRPLAHQPTREQIQFGVIPVLYYLFDYLTMVYTDLLARGEPVAVEFMPFVCCLAYLAFLLYYAAQRRRSGQLLQTQKVLEIQLNQSVREINALRESQALARQYRHDLRHHLQYVSSCLQNGQEEQAQRYIATICQEIEGQKVQRFSENEAANLILSAFAGRARKDGIELTVQCALPEHIKVTDGDLCVLLSNALENAVHACQSLIVTGMECVIDVQMYQREGRVFLQVTNPCGAEVRFEKGIPISEQPEHGVGVQSICAIVQRYGGVYAFSVQEGRFILRLSL